MTSLNQLRKQLARARAKESAERKVRMKLEEKARIKRQLFNLKHGKKIRVVKKVGKRLGSAGRSIGSGVSSAFGSFQKQRKSKKGIGGYLQRIADNQ